MVAVVNRPLILFDFGRGASMDYLLGVSKFKRTNNCSSVARKRAT